MSRPPINKEMAASENDNAVEKQSPPFGRPDRADTNRSNISTVRTALGLKSDAPIHEDHEGLEHHELLWSQIRLALREPFAEFFGTFIMVMFGDGSVAQVLLSAGNVAAPGKAGYGPYQTISWG